MGKKVSIIKNILNYIIEFLGIGISIYGLNKCETVNARFVFWILIISYIVIIAHNIFSVSILHIYSKKKQEIEREMEKDKNSYEISSDEIKNKLDKRVVLTEKSFRFDKLSNVSTNEYCSRVYDKVDVYYQQLISILEKDAGFIKLLDENDITVDEYVENPINEFGKEVLNNLISRERGIVKKELLHVYDEYTSKYLRDIHDFLITILDNEEYYGNISLSIKLCDMPYNEETKNYVDDIRVATAFRYNGDNEALENRETWTRVFSINKNSDFHKCLRRESFVENNLKPDNGHYMNENEDFYKYYNCTVVVPITYHRKLDRQLYGFLCCDTLCGNSEEVFSKHHADLLYSCAVNIGNLLDTIRFSWADVNDFGGGDDADDFFDYAFRNNLKAQRSIICN